MLNAQQYNQLGPKLDQAVAAFERGEGAVVASYGLLRNPAFVNEAFGETTYLGDIVVEGLQSVSFNPKSIVDEAPNATVPGLVYTGAELDEASVSLLYLDAAQLQAWTAFNFDKRFAMQEEGTFGGLYTRKIWKFPMGRTRYVPVLFETVPSKVGEPVSDAERDGLRDKDAELKKLFAEEIRDSVDRIRGEQVALSPEGQLTLTHPERG